VLCHACVLAKRLPACSQGKAELPLAERADHRRLSKAAWRLQIGVPHGKFVSNSRGEPLAMPGIRSITRGRVSRRRGSLTIEMVLVVTVLAIVTVGVVQFGMFFANADMVALAARVGAEEASQTPALPIAGGVPANIVSAIEHQLQSSRIDWAGIRLEHDVNPPTNVPVVLDSTQPGFVFAPKTILAGPPSPGTHYVRLTVAVPLNDAFPKQLSFFGQQLYTADRTYEHTVVLRYELANP
jgi:Flp pilus assembly protein TadG